MTQATPDPRHYLAGLFGLDGRRAVVTGGTSGIGRAAAQALAGAGAHVVVGGRDRARAAEVVGAIEAAGGTAELVIGDLGSRAGIAAFAADVLESGAPVDILVNSAGIFEREAGETTGPDLWDRAMHLNATATFELCQAFGRGMLERGRGKIVNIASTDGFVGVPEQAAYCASKGAVVQLTRTLGAEWIARGVHVNAIGPCDFDTPMIADALADPSYESWIHDAIPAGRIGRPEDVAGAVVYLASPASDLVVGHVLMVDGGRVAI
jgi:NAD(P)-dependent dehydrogenase (short-subunit alcohol dehydrogenase family)